MEYNTLGKELLRRLTEDGKKPIDKQIVATLSTEEIEALIIAIRSVENEKTNQTLSNLLDEHLQREPESSVGMIFPPCFYYWGGEGLDLCDFGGSYSIIEKSKCENCHNYCVSTFDLDRYLKPMPEDC